MSHFLILGVICATVYVSFKGLDLLAEYKESEKKCCGGCCHNDADGDRECCGKCKKDEE